MLRWGFGRGDVCFVCFAFSILFFFLPSLTFFVDFVDFFLFDYERKRHRFAEVRKLIDLEPLSQNHIVGTYLFSRISADEGQDSRFSSMRSSPPKFLTAFLLQAAWVSTCLMPVLALNAIPAPYFALLPASIAATDIIGLALFAGGFTLEIAADRQKSQWMREKREKKHDEPFLARGLWSRSRHPNYFGEMMLWTGIAVVAGGVLVRTVGQVGMGFAPLSLLLLRRGGGQVNASASASASALASASASATAKSAITTTPSLFRGRALGLLMAGISPAFVTALLLFVSGVPPSEAKYDARYGERADYQEWKRNTPMLVPKLF